MEGMRRTQNILFEDTVVQRKKTLVGFGPGNLRNQNDGKPQGGKMEMKTCLTPTLMERCVQVGKEPMRKRALGGGPVGGGTEGGGYVTRKQFPEGISFNPRQAGPKVFIQRNKVSRPVYIPKLETFPGGRT